MTVKDRQCLLTFLKKADGTSYYTGEVDGSLIKAGTRIQWNGKVIRAKVDLWDRADHSPENAPTLWEGI